MTEDYQKIEKEIREFMDKKLEGKNFIYSVSFTQNIENKVEYKVFFNTNVDPSKKPYGEVYPLVYFTLQLFDEIGKRFFPPMRMMDEAKK